jgi:hypothetical protein
LQQRVKQSTSALHRLHRLTTQPVAATHSDSTARAQNVQRFLLSQLSASTHIYQDQPYFSRSLVLAQPLNLLWRQVFHLTPSQWLPRSTNQLLVLKKTLRVLNLHNR